MNRDSAWSGLGRPLMAIPVAAAITAVALAMAEVADPGSVFESDAILRPWARWTLMVGVGAPIMVVVWRFLRAFLRRS